jgi:CelD/BcsL family acetyltransferase involved in cellulose biosynthesis
LNLLAIAADRISAEGPAAAFGAGFEKFVSNNKGKNKRRNFQRAQRRDISVGNLRICAMQKLQLCDGLAAPI